MTNGYRELVRFVSEQEHADLGDRLRGLDFRSFVRIFRREFARRLAVKVSKKVGS